MRYQHTSERGRVVISHHLIGVHPEINSICLNLPFYIYSYLRANYVKILAQKFNRLAPCSSKLDLPKFTAYRLFFFRLSQLEKEILYLEST